MKPSQLRSDPDKVRAWQDRSRERQIDRARQQRERAQHALAPDAAVKPKRYSRRVTFRAPSPAGEHLCVSCARQGRERGAVHWHHWLEQEQLRVYVRGLRLGDERLARRLARRLVQDRRNYSPVCVECHGNGSTHGHRFVFADVPPSAFAFALELGQEWFERLKREYPAVRT